MNVSGESEPTPKLANGSSRQRFARGARSGSSSVRAKAVRISSWFRMADRTVPFAERRFRGNQQRRAFSARTVMWNSVGSANCQARVDRFFAGTASPSFRRAFSHVQVARDRSISELAHPSSIVWFAKTTLHEVPNPGPISGIDQEQLPELSRKVLPPEVTFQSPAPPMIRWSELARTRQNKRLGQAVDPDACFISL